MAFSGKTKKIRTLLSDAGWKADHLKIVVHAVASLPAKQWPLERFAEVMKKLKEKNIMPGSSTPAQAKMQCCTRRSKSGALRRPEPLRCHERIRKYIAYRAADLFFGVDLGAHARGRGRRRACRGTLRPHGRKEMGPGERDIRSSPGGFPARSCKPHKCRDNECMKQIGVDEALDAVEKKIKQILPKVLFH